MLPWKMTLWQIEEEVVDKQPTLSGLWTPDFVLVCMDDKVVLEEQMEKRLI